MEIPLLGCKFVRNVLARLGGAQLGKGNQKICSELTLGEGDYYFHNKLKFDFELN